MFTGSWVALVTPMNDDGQVDYVALQQLVELHIAAGTDGIVSVGTTGESATLPFDEHINVVKRTVAFANGCIPVMAGSGANATAEAIFLSRQLESTGVVGFLSVVPYYNKPQQRGMIEHFTAIANATSLPTMLYNVPGRTSVDMLPETVAELAKHEKIIGLKDATGDIQRLLDTLPLVPDDFVILSGDDDTSLEFLTNGGHGVISVTANIVPKEMAQLCREAAEGNIVDATAINDRIKQLHTDLFLEPNPVMPKWALYKMGKIPTPVLRLPMVQPELVSQKQIEATLAALELVN
ncbi:4-hydroxy-tetrahydrodipicolinate synthase [Alteromonas sp. ASW11-36]|uniref:4-hydroxy-tetrahydrodipicolinate synthase n=1 Tax=Alteromonas arenosi TaxID=3055817 RepID=A0ABT7SX75_9ALTE|nr:4-hydroxy-tetrahydrodipicolinate synthase [Alteromonas sp. ASW11-36]MDM7860782.1 4-hydroxy-tetrahydrodipicolinate synthase [Alteromonas sp. ASW11-36]